jgi:hypothetical protein
MSTDALAATHAACPRVGALRLLAFLLVAAAALSAAAAADNAKADETNPHLWEPKTTSVAVFKNGLGFFIRQGEVELRDGWCLAERIPPATFGTLAVYSHKDDQTVDVVGAGPGEVVEFDGVDAADDLPTRRARLKALKQLRLELTYTQDGEDRTAAGKLVGIGDEYAVLESQQNSFAVPVADISRLQVLDLPLRVHVASDRGGAPARGTMGMAYLRKGITWIPEYTLKVLDDDTAELTCRGTLVNEAEDLIHCDVHFVVGVPHFVHTDFMAPVAVGQVIRTIGAAVAPPQVATQIMNRAAIASHQARRGTRERVVDRDVASDGGDLGAAVGNLPKMGGPAATDYTVYTKKDLTLRRGEKAIVTLFVKKIRYTHVYRWSPPGDIRHYLVLHNETDTAWTTGPCIAVSDERPLGEDLLKYTARGDAGELPVTTAVNIANKQSEREVDRKLKAHSPSHNNYLDLVTLEGELLIRNFETDTIDLRIETPVAGKPVKASDGGTLRADPTKLVLSKREGTITWSLAIEPGETKVLHYTYERYVPSR